MRLFLDAVGDVREALLQVANVSKELERLRAVCFFPQESTWGWFLRPVEMAENEVDNSCGFLCPNDTFSVSGVTGCLQIS